MQAGFQESMVTEKLVRSGYDPRAIRSEAELKMIINRIDASKKQSKEQKDKAMKQLAKIMDMKGREIPPGAKIMGGKALDDIPPPGSRGGPDDIAAPIKSAEESLKDMTEAEIAARMKKQNKEAIERFKKKMDEDPEDFADGGEVSGTFGVLSDNADISRIIDQKVTDYENEYMQRTGQIPPEFYGDKYRMQLQKEYLMENKADGGRAGFMAGGMGRRAFLKLMGMGGAGIAALKTGLINVFRPRSQAVEEVVETVTKTDAMGVPDHFAPLVNKIMKEGKLTKESDRIQTYQHPSRKDLELDYEMDSGSVGVRFETDQGAKADYYLKKSPPDEMNPRGGPDEFFDGEEVYRFGKDGDSYVKDFEEGISTGTSNLDEFVGIKKKDFASGGLAAMLGE